MAATEVKDRSSRFGTVLFPRRCKESRVAQPVPLAEAYEVTWLFVHQGAVRAARLKIGTWL
jgi:hypothetical protein